MTQQHIDFLLSKELTDGEMIKAGYMRFLDDDWKTYEQIYKENIDANFSFEHGCGNCRFDMVKRVFNFFWNKVQPTMITELQSDEMSDEQINEAHEEKPKAKPGRKAKK